MILAIIKQLLMKKILSLIIISFLSAQFLNGQSFSKGSSISDINFINGASAWGDYDNDGDLDLILIGTPSNTSQTNLFSNNGDGSFTEVTAHNIINVGNGDVEWADYNNDGYLDLLLTGTDDQGTYVTKLFKNNADETFSDISSSFEGYNASSCSWGDFNNDGYIDFIISGQTGSGNSIAIYKNLGNDEFQKIDIQSNAFILGDVEWADFDNDGDLDIGLLGTGAETIVFENEGDETFTSHQILNDGLMRSSLDWGDYNNDGSLDLVISGFSGSEQKLIIYKNENGTFSEVIDSDFIGGEQGNTRWIDYDNDGNLDIISSVIGSGVWATRLYHNDGNDEFSLDSNSGLPIDFSNISLIDIDQDGDLDVFFPSTFNSDNETAFYLNESPKANLLPNIPTLNNEQIEEASITFSWQMSSDPQTSETVSYNIFVTHEGDTIVSPNSLFDGKRKLIKSGNVQFQMAYTLSTRETGDYTYSVQAIDNSFNASAFTTVKSFHINYPPAITGTSSSLTTPEETPSTITINDLIVEDPDNAFPDDFTLTVLDGENYTVSNNEISPDIDFNGELIVPVSISDGVDESEPFNLSIEVLPINDIPKITGTTSTLTTPEETPFTITINDLIIEDPDNTFPDDFSLTVLDGENYSVLNTEISPDVGYIGILSVPVSVNDGTDESEQFTIEVDVTKILGTSTALEDSNFYIYPNPVFNHLNIDLNGNFDPNQLRIYNYSGKLIYSSNLESNNEKFLLDLSSFEKGYYILQLTNNAQLRINFKLIKE